MATDGSTFLDRLEKIKTIYNNVRNDDNELLTSEEEEAAANGSKYIKKSIIHLKWNLGELLFNRLGTDTQKKG
jgi:hypothetical protein